MTKGTEVMGALELARKMSHAQRPLVVLFSDGGDELSYEKESAYAEENGLKVCIVMLASSQGSTLPSDNGSLKDEDGHIVVSSRNDAINLIAEQSGGKVIDGADADAVMEWIERERSEDFAGSTTVTRYQELFYFPLVLALIAFVWGIRHLDDFVRGGSNHRMVDKLRANEKIFTYSSVFRDQCTCGDARLSLSNRGNMSILAEIMSARRSGMVEIASEQSSSIVPLPSIKRENIRKP
jgi:hypothetical protein